MTWRDADIVQANGEGLAFERNGERWWLPHHGIFTTHCRYWAHYVAQGSYFYCYEAQRMQHALRDGDFRVVYTGRKPQWPTNRGILYPANDDPADLLSVRDAHESFCGTPLIEMSRGKAGKMAELHFVGTVFARSGNGDIVNFAEAWQDQRGNDVQLASGDWVQVKLDRNVVSTGNLYVQTHTRTKGTTWLGTR